MKFHVFTGRIPRLIEEVLNEYSEKYKIIDVKMETEATGSVFVTIMYEDEKELLTLGKLKQENEELMGALNNLRKVNEELDSKLKQLNNSEGVN